MQINEIGDTPKGQYALGRLMGRKAKRGQRYDDIHAYSEKARNNDMELVHHCDDGWNDETCGDDWIDDFPEWYDGYHARKKLRMGR